MSSSALGARLRALTQGGSSIAVAMAVTNVATYGFTMIAARVLGPALLRRLRRPDGDAADHGCPPARAPGHGRPADRGRAAARRPDRAVDPAGDLPRRRWPSARCCCVLSPLVNAVLRLDSLLAAALVARRPPCRTRSWAARPASSRASAAGGRSRRSTSASGCPAWSSARAIIAVATRASRPRCSASRSRLFVPVVIGWFALRDRAPRRASRQRPHGPPGRAGDRPQLPGAARVLRAVQRRRGDRPQRARRAPGGPLRRRPDHGRRPCSSCRSSW